VEDSEAEELRNYEKDASNGLSHMKLLETINKRHPRKMKKIDDQHVVYEEFKCCGTSTGMLSCVKSQRDSEFKDFGPGITVYF
jgi:hypothetical protein